MSARTHERDIRLRRSAVARALAWAALAASVAAGDAMNPDVVTVTKTSPREVVVAGTFAVRPDVLFDAITRPDSLQAWMSAGALTLDAVDVDARAGGSFRYAYRRPSGRTIEVRGAYTSFDPPLGFAYVETYDFSPLCIEVTTTLHEVGAGTRFTQTLRYASTRERDEDFEGIASSAREAYAKLARLLAGRE
jgi:uncharacterized protein YndB with AHSA1/START domain